MHKILTIITLFTLISHLAHADGLPPLPSPIITSKVDSSKADLKIPKLPDARPEKVQASHQSSIAPVDKPKPPAIRAVVADDQENSSFIDKGTVALPVAPGVKESSVAPPANQQPQAPVQQNVIVEDIHGDVSGPAKQAPALNTAPAAPQPNPKLVTIEATPAPHTQSVVSAPQQNSLHNANPIPPIRPANSARIGKIDTAVSAKQVMPYSKPSPKLVQKPAVVSNIVAPKADLEQIRFLKDEMIMLRVDDDDIVLGSLTDKARLEQMNYVDYLHLVAKSLQDEKDFNKANEIAWFVLSHSKEGSDVEFSRPYLLRESTDSIDMGNLTTVRTLSDYYAVVNLVDNKGNNLLHLATSNANAPIAKWLIMKGVDINALNMDAISPLGLAESNQYWEIFNLLEKAGAK